MPVRTGQQAAAARPPAIRARRHAVRVRRPRVRQHGQPYRAPPPPHRSGSRPPPQAADRLRLQHANHRRERPRGRA